MSSANMVNKDAYDAHAKVYVFVSTIRLETTVCPVEVVKSVNTKSVEFDAKYAIFLGI